MLNSIYQLNHEYLDEGWLEFFDNQHDVIELIKDVLCLNPHSTHVLKAHDHEQLYAVELDNINVVYLMDAEKQVVKVVDIMDIKDCQDYYT